MLGAATQGRGLLQWFGQVTPWCFSIFKLRPDSIRFGDKAIFRPKKLTWNLSFWDFGFGQKTPWCWCDLAKRLLGPDSALAPGHQPWHQGVFWPNQKSQKLKLQVSFLGLNIALSPNLIGSSDTDFYKDSKSGLKSKKKTPRSHLAKPM